MRTMPPSFLPRAILFDLDGVLVSSKKAWFSLMQDVGNTFRGRPISWEEFEPTFGQATSEDISVFGLAVTPDDLDRYYTSHFRFHAAQLAVDPAAARVLLFFRERAIPIGVVTNTVTPLALEILSALKLETYPSVVLGPGQGCRGKPAPDLLLSALSTFGVAPRDAWMIGDSVFDRQAANAAGTIFIGLGVDGDARIEGLLELEEPRHQASFPSLATRRGKANL